MKDSGCWQVGIQSLHLQSMSSMSMPACPMGLNKNACAQAVFGLSQLRLLAVRASGLRKLTAEVAAFRELRRLDVSRSRDLEVHEDIPWASMTSLRSLDLSECRHLRVSRGVTLIPSLLLLCIHSLHGVELCLATASCPRAASMHRACTL